MQLTPAQHRVLVRLARGETNRQIADALRIAETTVKKHVSAILRNHKIANRTQLALRFNGGLHE